MHGQGQYDSNKSYQIGKKNKKHCVVDILTEADEEGFPALLSRLEGNFVLCKLNIQVHYLRALQKLCYFYNVI